MKKVLYIFLAHVVVLGAIWTWKQFRNSDSLPVGDRYQQVMPYLIKDNIIDKPGLKILFCIDRDEIDGFFPGQHFNVPMFVYADGRDMEYYGFEKSDAHACFHILLNGFDPD